MVVRTEVCLFSEYKIYPGRGHKFVSKDGKTNTFISKKSRKLYLAKVKPQRIRWTTAWRRLHKKIQTEEFAKKKKRRNVKIQKGIVGLSLEEIKRKRTEKPEVRQAQREQAMREIKDRRQKELEAKRKTAGALKDKKAEAKQAKGAEKKVVTKQAGGKKK